MAPEKQKALTNWLLGLATTAATASAVFAWDTNAKLSVLEDHDMQHSAVESHLYQKIDDLQISQFDTQTRITHLEDKVKTR